MLETIREYAREQLETPTRLRSAPPPCGVLRRARGGGLRVSLRRGGRVVGPPRRSITTTFAQRSSGAPSMPDARSSWPARWAGSGSPTWHLGGGKAAARGRARRSAAAGAHTCPSPDVVWARSRRGSATSNERGDAAREGDRGSGASSATRRRSRLRSTPSAGPLPLRRGRDDEQPGAFERASRSAANSATPGERDPRARRRRQILVAMGEVDRAEPLSLELLDLAGGDLRTEHFAHHYLADWCYPRRLEHAEERYRESLRAAVRLGDVVETTFEVQGVAMAAAGKGDPSAAPPGRVGRAALAVARRLDLRRVLGPAPRALHRHGARRARQSRRCGVEGGHRLQFDDAVVLALQSTETARLTD